MKNRLAELQSAGRWPKGLPRNYDELYRRFHKLVIKQVYHYRTDCQPPKDAIGYVWVKLLEVDLLSQFVLHIEHVTGIPEKLTTGKAVHFLGITQEVFTSYLKEEGCLLKYPVEGAREDATAIWLTADILDLSLRVKFPGQTEIQVPPVDYNPAQFMGYLCKAVKRHYSNYRRTEGRRHKERPGDLYFPSPTASDTDHQEWVERYADGGFCRFENELEIGDIIRLVEEHAPGFGEDIFFQLNDGRSLVQAVQDTKFLTRRDRANVIKALNLPPNT
jgi:hypothetical protein